MKRLIQLLQIPALSPYLVMNYVFEELTEAFKDYGCEIKIVKDFSQIQDGGIVFLDNAACTNNRALLESIGERCPHSVFILWYWTDTSFKPFARMIYTGEYNLKVPSIPNLRNRHLTYMTLSNFAPLKLRANENPNAVGTYQRNVLRDYCYMGCEYKRDWLPAQFTGLYHVGGWQNYLSYNQRRDIYLSSMFALGFQSEDNIDSGHLSQRLFEGMAYGCIVFCENPLAAEITGGIIVNITDKEDLARKMAYYKENPVALKKKQEKGYEWVKQYGTNRVSAKTYLEKIQELFGLHFD